MRSPILKRIIDIIFSFILLIILLPLILIISFLVFCFLGRHVLFKQQRPGFKGAPFIIYKFRTMRDLYDTSGKLLDDEQRLTRFGKFLRSTSLDELPELINVLNGTMRIVGPR